MEVHICVLLNQLLTCFFCSCCCYSCCCFFDICCCCFFCVMNAIFCQNFLYGSCCRKIVRIDPLAAVWLVEFEVVWHRREMLGAGENLVVGATRQWRFVKQGKRAFWKWIFVGWEKKIDRCKFRKWTFFGRAWWWFGFCFQSGVEWMDRWECTMCVWECACVYGREGKQSDSGSVTKRSVNCFGRVDCVWIFSEHLCASCTKERRLGWNQGKQCDLCQETNLQPLHFTRTFHTLVRESTKRLHTVFGAEIFSFGFLSYNILRLWWIGQFFELIPSYLPCCIV